MTTRLQNEHTVGGRQADTVSPADNTALATHTCALYWLARADYDQLSNIYIKMRGPVAEIPARGGRANSAVVASAEGPGLLPAPAQPAAQPKDTLAALRDLKGLLDDGTLTHEEFDAQKKVILGRGEKISTTNQAASGVQLKGETQASKGSSLKGEYI